MPSFNAPTVNLILEGGQQISVSSSPRYVRDALDTNSGTEFVEFESYSQYQKHPTQTATINSSKVFVQRSSIIGYILTSPASVVFDPAKALQSAPGQVPHIGR